MSANPHSKLPRTAYWRSSVARAADRGGAIAGLWTPKFEIGRSDKVLTAGSCFAQHISRALQDAGFDWHEAERAPFGLAPATARDFGYGIFSFRTGNIYTTRVLLQWLRWVNDPATQDREVWVEDGAYFDPVRPQIEPGGFETEDELFDARQATLNALRNGIAQASVLVFTLGLTEGWQNTASGLAYSACPGTIGGVYDSSAHAFHNLGYNEIMADLAAIRVELRRINPDIRLLLTVSPVPLVATAHKDVHVLRATTYSKSVLRAAAGVFSAEHEDVDYFPSYEIVTTPGLPQDMFEDDRRSVRPEAVAFVMQHFMEGLGVDAPDAAPMLRSDVERIGDAVAAASAADDLICEEMELERFNDHRD